MRLLNNLQRWIFLALLAVRNSTVGEIVSGASVEISIESLGFFHFALARVQTVIA